MAGFSTYLDIKILGDQYFEVVTPLIYIRDKEIISVNPGFDFDGASVPQVLWSFGLSPMTGGYQRAACLHDAMYSAEIFDREVCDKIFLEAMKSDNVSYFKRMSMYFAVRIFGKLLWKKHTIKDVLQYNKFITVVTSKDTKQI